MQIIRRCFARANRAQAKGFKWFFYSIVMTLAVITGSCNATANKTAIWYIHNAYFSPEVRRLGTIRLIDPENGQGHTVIQEQPGYGIVSATFSPNGTHIAYVAGSVSGEADQGANVVVTESDGANPQNIITTNYTAAFYWLSAISLLTVGVERKPDKTLETQWGLYDISKNESRKVSYDIADDNKQRCGPIHAAQGDDHLWLVWDETTMNSEHLIVENGAVKIATGSKYNFPDLQTFYGGYCSNGLSADGKFAFAGGVGQNAPKFSDVFVGREDDKSIIRLTDFQRDYSEADTTSLSISPDAQWVIFGVSLLSQRTPTLSEGNYVAVVNVGNKEVNLLAKTWVKGNFVWSPDSKYVAAALQPPGTGDPPEIFIVDIQARTLKQMTFDGVEKEVIDWRYVKSK